MLATQAISAPSCGVSGTGSLLCFFRGRRRRCRRPFWTFLRRPRRRPPFATALSEPTAAVRQNLVAAGRSATSSAFKTLASALTALCRTREGLRLLRLRSVGARRGAPPPRRPSPRDAARHFDQGCCFLGGRVVLREFRRRWRASPYARRGGARATVAREARPNTTHAAPRAPAGSRASAAIAGTGRWTRRRRSTRGGPALTA